MPGWWHRRIATWAIERGVNFPPYNPSLWYGVTSHDNQGFVGNDYVYTGAVGSLDGLCSFTPITILRQQKFNGFAFVLITNTIGTIDWRAAIYDVREEYVSDCYFAGSPNRKLIDFGTFQTTAPGIYEFTVPDFELYADNYWFALNIKTNGGTVELQAMMADNATTPGLVGGRPHFIFGSEGAGDPFGSSPFGRIGMINIFDWVTFPTMPDVYPDQFGGLNLLYENVLRNIWFRTVAP